jgi:CubicO group peptidase (beta-lactamase class C family)
MKQWVLIALLLITALSDASARTTIAFKEHEIPVNLRRTLIAAFNVNNEVGKVQFTKDDQFFVMRKDGIIRFSDTNYFKALRGAQGTNLYDVAKDAGNSVVDLSIGPQNHWVLLKNRGIPVYSDPTYFSNIGLSAVITRVRTRLRAYPNPILKIDLGPSGAWVLVDATGQVHHAGFTKDLADLLDSLNDSKTSLDSISFRHRNDGNTHFLMVSGHNVWKSGAPGTPIWNDSRELIRNGYRITVAAQRAQSGHVLISSERISVERTDLLSRIEENVGGMNIHDLMEQHRVTGMMIGLVENGQVTDVRSYGWRNRNRWEHVNNKTYFHAASISKAVASAGILRGNEDILNRSLFAVLNGDTSLTLSRKWYASLSVAQRNRVMYTPLHTLLSHSSGLGVHGIGAYETNSIPSIEDLLMGRSRNPRRDKVEPVHLSQTRYRYSGGAYTLIENIFAEKNRTSFAALMQARILNPLGMNQSTFGGLSIEQRKNYAHGHVGNGGRNPISYRVCPGKAAGGLYTTAGDYARFLAMLSNYGLNGRGDRARPYLSASEFRLMMTPGHHRDSSKKSCTADSHCSGGEKCIYQQCLQVVQHYETLREKAYGLGVDLSTNRQPTNGHPLIIEHGGVHEGHHSYFYHSYGRDRGIVILTNGLYDINSTEKCGGSRDIGARCLRAAIISSFRNL